MTNCQAMVMVIEFPNQLFRNKTWAIYDFVKFLSTVPQMPPYVYVYCINLCVVLCMYIHIIYIYIEANYTNGWNVWGERFLAVNHHNHKNLVPSILTHNLWLIFMGMKQNGFFCWKTKFKMADSKKLSFSKQPILNIFLKKFLDWSLG